MARRSRVPAGPAPSWRRAQPTIPASIAPSGAPQRTTAKITSATTNPSAVPTRIRRDGAATNSTARGQRTAARGAQQNEPDLGGREDSLAQSQFWPPKHGRRVPRLGTGTSSNKARRARLFICAGETITEVQGKRNPPESNAHRELLEPLKLSESERGCPTRSVPPVGRFQGRS